MYLYVSLQILEHTKLKNDFWDGLVMFMKNEMIPRYQKLLSGHFEEDGKQTLTAEAQADEFLHEIQQLLKKVAENPEQVLFVYALVHMQYFLEVSEFYFLIIEKIP